MQLLDFARGPGMQIALAVFALGVTWRIISLAFMPRTKDKTPAKEGSRSPLAAIVWENLRKLKPNKTFMSHSYFMLVNGYTFHICFMVVVLFFAPHIAFFKDLLGVSWPALSNNIIYAFGVLTLATLAAALIRRLTNPVQRLISTADDYITWFVTFTPVLTGLLANTHLFIRYETALALHILSVELFLIWFPFGKLMHSMLVFVTRSQTGVHLAHRGAQP